MQANHLTLGTWLAPAALLAMGAFGMIPTARAAEPAEAPPPLDPVALQRASGVVPTTTPDGVVRLAWPRDGVPVRVDGVLLPPAAGLTSWAALAPAPSGALLMGDTVVFEDEVDAAVDAAFAQGLEVTALHNHFFFDQPKVYFLHIGGMGEAHRLAGAVKAVWDAVRAVRSAAPVPTTLFGGETPSRGDLEVAAFERIVGHGATVNDGVLKVTIGREGRMHGVPVGGSMGLTTWIALTGSDRLAAATGDVMLAAHEVQPVLRTLRGSGFHLVALHNHMIGESPAYYFVHFWAKGPAQDLARGFRAVLDAQAAVAQGGGH